MNTQPSVEPIIEPDLPIVDAHHHLWLVAEPALAALEQDASTYAQLCVPTFRRSARYLLEEYLADIKTGHNIRATVYVEAHAMYPVKGVQAMKPVGEVEFANGTAAMAASGLFGDVAVCAGIIGNADLLLGDAVQEVLLAELRAGGSRFRGIRTILMYDEDTNVLTHGFGNTPHIALDKRFREGFKHLEPLGLSFEAWMLEPQLPELLDLARSFPGTRIVVNHTGGPVGLGRFTGRLAERFPIWRESIQALARCPNVLMKLGGLGQPNTGFRTTCAKPRASSSELAAEWRPYIETCIEVFGEDRCMFESNFPPDSGTANYPVLWNAFKRCVSGASSQAKAALFSGTATRVYRLDL